MDFAIDPTLFGVAGPSTSAAGRVREVPSLLQQHEEAKSTTRVPLLSDSGSSEEEADDDEEDEEEQSNNDSDEESAASSNGVDDSVGDEEDATPRIYARDKGKGRAKQTMSQPTAAFNRQIAALPPMPEPLPPSSTGEPLPPLPPGLHPSHSALYAETDGETDYATDGAGLRSGSRKQGELGRLINAIRDTSATSAPTTATNRGFLGREWDRNMEQELEDLDLDERTTSGRPKKKSRGRVAAGDVEPSPEIRNMLGSANLAYVQGRQKEAIDILNEIIRIDPATRAAWYTLSTIQEELGNMDKAIQLRIVVAHLTKGRADTWKELGAQSRELGLLEQAAYCYGEAIRCDRTDVEAIWDRASLLRETGKTRQASTWFLKLLKLQPHNPSILRELGPLYYELNEVPKAVQLYQAAYDHFRSLYPVPSPSADELQGWSNVDFELLADFLRSLKRYKEAGKIIVEGVRWLQGRSQEGASWASFGDDREYDLERKWRPGWEDHANRWCEEAPVHPLDTGLRLRLGLARLYEGRISEAKVHFEIIRQRDIMDIPDVYGEIADAYFDRSQWEEALEVYKEMSENEETNVAAVWIKIAQCQRHLGELQDAAESYQAVIQNVPDDLDSRLALAEIYERLDMREEALELVNEVIESRRAARDSGLIDSDESASEYADNASEADENRGILFSQRRKKRKSASRKRLDSAVRRRTFTQEERMEEERSIQEAFDASLRRLHEVDQQIGEAIEPETGGIPEHLHLEWLDLASQLLDVFRTTKALFPSDGKKKYIGIKKGFKRKQQGVDEQEEENVDEQAAGIAERLQASLQDEEQGDNDGPDMNVEQNAYRGVSFDEWAALAVRYAFMLTRIDERGEAQEVLRHMLKSSMMRQDAPRNQFLIFGLVACALYCEDYEGALEDLRKVISSRKMESEPLRILQAICHSGILSLDAFANSKFQKYLLRMIKLIDQRALPSLGGNAADDKDDSADEADMTNMQMIGTDFKPTKVNPHFLMLYGHILACGKSYQSAIVYYLRVYDLYPRDPLICLSLASAYTHRAMQRQTDNRHYQLAQALAFLDGYRKLAGNQQEVQYNVARIFHQLGIVDLAVKHYEKVLEMLDQDEKLEGTGITQSKGLDLSREAAYNLSSIYFTRGSPDLARQVAERYLSL